ncbi:phospholipase A [Massilia rhizosphaerae]|uniref:phospholipase A n=1 Tax=Massilia rhizosphaerae TaxID=2784389 RepID=UPI0018DCC285|nr:phospholipase A [Massilia rhizosphaerae]
MPVTDSRFLPLISFLALSPALAHQTDPGLAACARIADAGQRLACYDRLAGVTQLSTSNPTVDMSAHAAASQPAPLPAPATTATVVDLSPVPDAVDIAPESTRGFSLADHWELDQNHKRGTFNFRPHLVNYLMATRTARPNDEPYRPFRRLDVLTSGLAHSELVFQLGFKMKLVENAFDKPIDLWFGYTQNSFWQAGNHKASSPFRETNYQPELMAVTPLHFSLLGMRARFLNLGLVHQSNGQASTLSRSWNRVYAQVGLERAGWTVLGRVWKRINEAAASDDNRNIVDYMGRGDLAVTYRANGSDYSALLRHNFSTGRGALQLSWAFPLAGHLKGYAQVFSGYGQSLIDYNYYQNTVGLGLLGTF